MKCPKCGRWIAAILMIERISNMAKYRVFHVDNSDDCFLEVTLKAAPEENSE
jgi:hypothetical protein